MTSVEHMHTFHYQVHYLLNNNEGQEQHIAEEVEVNNGKIEATSSRKKASAIKDLKNSMSPGVTTVITPTMIKNVKTIKKKTGGQLFRYIR